jgi:hypothetical protein
MYIVATADNGIADIVFTNSAGTASRSTANRAFIESIIAATNSGSADQLSTARLISITGDATWEVSFDGSGNVTGALTLASVGTAGEQGGIVTTDAQGRVISSRALLVSDLPDLPGSKITSDISVNTTGNDGMAKGGSGDILTGLAAGLLAQGVEPFAACCCAVWLHGRAGDLAAQEKGQWGMTPTDLLERLPQALREVTE